MNNMNAKEARRIATPIAVRIEKEALEEELESIYAVIATSCAMGRFVARVDAMSSGAKNQLIEKGYEFFFDYDSWSISW